jgi:hypothetical protein
MYAQGGGDQRLIVGIYVDHLIITGSNSTELKQFKEQMKEKFQMADLGKQHFYLRLDVNQTSTSTMVRQGAYAMKIMWAAALAGCNSSHTPMDQCLKLSKSSTTLAVNPTKYRRIIGALRYLVNTRPDLAYAVGYVSRFMEEPTKEHLLAVKRVLQYVVGTVHQGCFYKKKGEKLKLTGYSDNDLTRDVNILKSTTSVLYFLDDNVVSWQSYKQRVVVLLSCKDEYIAVAIAPCQAMWLGRLLAEIRGEGIDSVTLKIDNVSAIQLTRKLVLIIVPSVPMTS